MRTAFWISLLLTLMLFGCGDGTGRDATAESHGEVSTEIVVHPPPPKLLTGDDYIAQKWQQLGGTSGALGAYGTTYAVCYPYPVFHCTSTQLASVPVGPNNVGLMQQFANGQIYWSPSTGAFAVLGQILTKYEALGGASGMCGFPVSDQTSDGVGVFNDFQDATILYSAATGAHEVHGGIRDRYRAIGAGKSVLGYPTTDETGLQDGVGRYNNFAKGSIDWSPASGAFELFGSIRDEWLALNGVNSYLGYPTAAETWSPSLPLGLGSGYQTRFQRGSIVWLDNTGNGVVDIPDQVSFSQQVLTPDGTALGGTVTVTLKSDGSWSFSGHMHDSGFDGYSYRVAAVVNSAAGIPVASVHSGSVQGTSSNLLGSVNRDDNWNESGTSPILSVSWDLVKEGSLAVSKSYSDTGVLGTIDDLAKFLVNMVISEVVLGPYGPIITIGSELGQLTGVKFAGPGGVIGAYVTGSMLYLTGIAGLVIAVLDATTVSSRSLTSAEIAFVDPVFKGTVPYNRVLLTNMTGGQGRAFTFPNVDGSILVNIGAAYGDPTHNTDHGYKPGELLVHELTHAFQIQAHDFTSGWICDEVATQAANTLVSDQYKYGPPGPAWSSFNFEQKGKIVQQWFAGSRVAGQKPMDFNDPYFGYIANHIWLGAD